MSLLDLPVFAALKRQMHWLHANQKVVAENIANADTPGYRAKEMAREDFSNLVSSLEDKQTSRGVTPISPVRLQATEAGHVGGNARGLPDAKETDKYEETLDGNAVELEVEMMKSAANQMENSMVANLYRKNMEILRVALTKGR